MKKIKVLRIIARLNIGGPAIHTILLTEGLNKDRFESILACGKVAEGERDMMYLAESKGVKPIIIPELGRELSLKNDLIAFWKLFILMIREKPDIVHTHTAKAGALGRLAALIAGVKFRVHTFHGHIFHSYFGNLKTKIFILIERLISLFTSKIIVVSQQINRELLQYRISSDDKIEIVNLGFELENLLSLNNDVNDDSMRVGIVGRLTAIKNHKLFLDAAKELLRVRKHGANFIIVGDGELKQELEKYASSLGIDKHVEFRGWQKSLENIYKNLDIVCLTSLNEGTPVSLIEAMAAGRPVVATNVGGIKDIVLEESSTFNKNYDKITVSDRGVAVDSFAPEVFAEAISLLIKDKDLRMDLGSNGRKFVEKRFKKDRLIKDIESLYNRLIIKKE